jgi:hypothetical protein
MKVSSGLYAAPVDADVDISFHFIGELALR